MTETMAVYLTIEDPEALESAEAYCVLSEVHMNFKTHTLVVIFECWRSREAYEAKRKSFTAIQVQFESDKGGINFYRQYGVDGAELKLGNNIREFCLKHSNMLKNATRAENIESSVPGSAEPAPQDYPEPEDYPSEG